MSTNQSTVSGRIWTNESDRPGVDLSLDTPARGQGLRPQDPELTEAAGEGRAEADTVLSPPYPPLQSESEGPGGREDTARLQGGTVGLQDRLLQSRSEMLLTPALSCHTDTAHRSQSPLLIAFLAFSLYKEEHPRTGSFRS